MLSVYDAIVIGQGLAGTAVAWQLLWSGQRVLVIDNNAAVTSSKVAAGLITPITGQRLVISWQFAEFWATAIQHYRRVESATKTNCFRETPMVRLLSNELELERFHQRLHQAEFQQMVHFPPTVPLDETAFRTNTPAFEMTTAGQLDVITYLRASQNHFQQRERFLEASIKLPDDVHLTSQGVSIPRYGVSARQLLFCEGVAATSNPWFQHVRFRPAKGEILTLRIPQLTENRVVHHGVWLAPGPDGNYRSGATYEWQELNQVPTAAGRAEIEQRLQEFLLTPYEVVSHQAAVRPIHLQQYPVLGRHPEYPQLGFLNGLGSKGTLQAPRLANELMAVMQGAAVFDVRCDIHRTRKSR